jgi:hypothetical protein
VWRGREGHDDPDPVAGDDLVQVPAGSEHRQVRGAALQRQGVLSRKPTGPRPRSGRLSSRLAIS